MKNLLLILSTSLILCACNSGKDQTHTTQTVNVKNIETGPVVHDSLTTEQIEKIKTIHTTFLEVYPITLEETTTHFKNDVDVDNEISIWLIIADAYEKYISSKQNKLELDAKKEAFSLILSRSMMTNEEAIKNTKLKKLTVKNAQEVLSYYTAQPDPIEVVKKK